jgi:hypothetical protein
MLATLSLSFTHLTNASTVIPDAQTDDCGAARPA